MYKSKHNNGDGMELSILEREETGKHPRVEEVEYEFNQFKWRDLFTKAKYIPWWILAVLIGVAVALMTIYHNQIVETLRPISEKIKDVPGGFIIPVVILIVISFPPLFGHEIVALLCGVVWGLWVGFAIVAAGTFIGEIGTWYAFKYAFRRKAEKLEKTNLNYGSLARMTREGGFWVILLIRFSVIPTHLSTAVFSTCDVKFWHFALATFLTSPKQITIVYVGVLLTQEKQDALVNGIVLFATTILTLVAAVYILLRMKRVKKALIEEQATKQAEKRAQQERQDSQGHEPVLQPAYPQHEHERDLHRQPERGFV